MMISTLGFLIPPAKLGKVTLYPLSEEFGRAWKMLPGYSDNAAKPSRPAYSSLATALSAVTGQPVVLMPDVAGLVEDEYELPAVLVTTKPITPSVLSTAARVWEKLIREGEDRNTIAPILSATAPTRPSLSSFIREAKDGRPQANGWFYRVAAWKFAQLLGRQPLAIHDYARGEINWRLDTAGSLLAWNDVLERSLYQGRVVGRSMHKLDFRIITLPGESKFVLNIMPTFTRLASHWASTRTALVARGGSKGTVLRLPVGHSKDTENNWKPYVRNYTADVVEQCGLEAITLGTNEDLFRGRGKTRALVPGPCEFPLGKGTGTMFDFLVAKHASAVLQGLEQVTYEDSGILLPEQTAGQIVHSDLDRAIEAAEHENVRILALYSEPYTRHRMVQTLGEFIGASEPPHFIDGQDQELTGKLAVRFRHVPALTTTTEVNWDRELAFTSELPAGTLNAAWLETPWKPTTARQTKEARRSGTVPIDHKRELRRRLYRDGIVSQFMRTTAPPEPRAESAVDDDEPQSIPRQRASQDYRARNALRDLLFRAGALDTRIARYADLDRSAMLVGIHIRQQRATTKRIGSANTTQMVTVLTAVTATSDPAQPWRIQMYDLATNSWRDQAPAESSFGSRPIGRTDHARHREGAENVRQHIEAALKVLPTGLPVVIYVDTEACRTIYPGLQHAQLGQTQALLPGASLVDEGRDVAVVAFNTSYGEVPQPVDRPGGRRRKPNTPLAPQDRLYRRTTKTKKTTWVLAQASRTYSGFGESGRAGGRHTRFTIPKEKEAFYRDDWHSFTAVHYVIVTPGSWNGQKLAQLTAQLCHQPIAGDDRTTYPIPLHVAKVVDQAHPEYRGPTLPNEATTSEADKA